MKIRILFFTAIMAVSHALSANPAAAKNLHQIDEDPQTGFAIYRTGKPNLKAFQEICSLGITQMIVLSGDADKAELKYRDQYCPQMELLYNERQTVKNPLTVTFLKQFDEWVRIAKEKGLKLAFRCDCGCHRTGRLAAYYEMKYMGASSEDAVANMKALGHWMFLYPHLQNQVWALEDHIQGRTCSQDSRYCVKEDSFSSSIQEDPVYEAADGVNDPNDASSDADGLQELQEF